MNLPRRSRDEGVASIEAVIIAPVLILFICLALAAGRIVLSSQAVDNSAEDAARAASSARDAGQARQRAYTAALDDVRSQNLKCTPAVTLDTSRFPTKAGQSGYVRVTVSCTVKLSDLIGFSGRTKTMKSSWTSYVDTYEQRG